MKKQLFILTLIALTAFSCSKDDDISNTNTPEIKLTQTTDGSQQTQFQYQDDRIVSFNKQDGTDLTLGYDANNRLIQYDNNTFYYYNDQGNINLITKGNISATIAYNSSQRIIQQTITSLNDPILNTDVTIERNFSYNGQGQLIQLLETSDFYENFMQRTQLAYDSRGNVIQRIVSNSNDSGNTFEVFYSSNYLYDESPNVENLFMEGLGINSNLHFVNNRPINDFEPIIMGEYYLNLNVKTPNNPTNIVLNFQTGEVTMNINYTYNDDGLVINAEKNKIAINGVQTTKILTFTYD